MFSVRFIDTAQRVLTFPTSLCFWLKSVKPFFQETSSKMCLLPYAHHYVPFAWLSLITICLLPYAHHLNFFLKVQRNISSINQIYLLSFTRNLFDIAYSNF